MNTLRTRSISVLLVGLIMGPCGWGQAVEADSFSRRDLHGDPLPASALTRLGTIRLRQGAHLTAAACSPDGTLLASTGDDATLRLWEVASGEQRWCLSNQGRSAQRIEFSPDGATITAALGASLERWDVRSGRQLGSLARHPSPITSFHYSSTGRLVVSVSHGFQLPLEIRVTDATTGQARFRYSLDAVQAADVFEPRVALTPDERLLLLSVSDNTIEAWGISEHQQAYTVATDGLACRNWRIAAEDRALIATSNGLGSLFVWDVATGKLRYRLCSDCKDKFTVVSQANRLLVTNLPDVTSDYRLEEVTTEYDLKTGKRFGIVGDPAGALGGAAPDGTILAFEDAAKKGEQRRQVALVQYPAKRRIQEFTALEFLRMGDGSRHYHFSPHNRLLALVRDGKTTWGCGEGNCVYFGASWPALLELRALPSGKLLMRRQYARGTPFHWRAAEAIEEGALGLIFSPDGRRVVTWGPWPALRVWDAATGAEVTGHAGHDGVIRSGFFTQDATKVVSLDEIGRIYVWDSRTGRKLFELPQMETDVQTVAVSPDGRHLVTFETRDGWLEVVGLWELSTGKLVARIARRFQPGMHSPEFPYLRAAGFANTGDVQVIGTLGGKLMAWTFTITQAAARAAQNVAKPISEAERSSLLSLDEVATATEIAPLHQGEYTAGIALFPSGSYLAHIVSATDRSNLRLYSRSTGRCVFELPEHPRPDGIFRTAVHPLGKLIAYVGVHGGKEIVDVWDIVAGRRLRRLTDFKGPVDSLAFSPDGKALATGSAKEIFFDPENMYDRRPRITQGAIVLWELATGLPRRSFPAHSAAICSLAFSSDGQRLVSGCADSTLLVWDVASPR